MDIFVNGLLCKGHTEALDEEIKIGGLFWQDLYDSYVQKQTEVQTLILSKEKFKTRADAKKWVDDHDFRSDKIDETENSYRFRQKEPSDFIEGSFRTIEITDGVKAVIGKPKTKNADEDEAQ